MKLYLKTKPVLDERELQEMYRIEHHGLWGMYTLLCAAVVVQLLFGADFAQMAGEMIVIAVVSVAMIIAYARRGIWDVRSRPSARGNAVYAALSSVGVAVITLGKRGSLPRAALAGGVMFVLCFALLNLLMAYVRHRQRRQEQTFEE
ncbi:MAG: hypothetical protein Q4G52_04810 [Clostridia bacterium]|nr:hypothetical protein [Clostridia bacterium]